eukprot:171175-Prorocentrum_minimum.AAC.2
MAPCRWIGWSTTICGVTQRSRKGYLLLAEVAEGSREGGGAAQPGRSPHRRAQYSVVIRQRGRAAGGQEVPVVERRTQGGQLVLDQGLPPARLLA